MLYTAGTRAENARRALAYWQAHQDTTIFFSVHGAYAVVEEAQMGYFGPARWTQTSPEEVVGLLLNQEHSPDEELSVMFHSNP